LPLHFNNITSSTANRTPIVPPELVDLQLALRPGPEPFEREQELLDEMTELAEQAASSPTAASGDWPSGFVNTNFPTDATGPPSAPSSSPSTATLSAICCSS
jgi:hypothetical protein